MLINQKREDHEKELRFYLYFYFQKETGQHLLEKWRFHLRLDHSPTPSETWSFLRAVASLTLQMPFNKYNKTQVVSHQV
jgi:hypothetical protein